MTTMGVFGGLYGGRPNGFKKILMGPGPEQCWGRSLIRHGYSIPPRIPRVEVTFCLSFTQEPEGLSETRASSHSGKQLVHRDQARKSPRLLQAPV